MILVVNDGSTFTSDDFMRSFGATSNEMDDLCAFEVQLASWNDRMNLVGPGTLASFWRRHVLDSAQLLHVEQSALVWTDVGAGAGFPGLVLAILLKNRTGACVHLIESMGKRVRFLEAVASALRLPVTIHHARAEAVRPPKGLQIVTARACAPFPRLFDYTAHFFKAGAQGLFLKGREVEAELTEAQRHWTVEASLIPSQSDPSGRIVRIERLASRGR